MRCSSPHVLHLQEQDHARVAPHLLVPHYGCEKGLKRHATVLHNIGVEGSPQQTAWKKHCAPPRVLALKILVELDKLAEAVRHTARADHRGHNDLVLVPCAPSLAPPLDASDLARTQRQQPPGTLAAWQRSVGASERRSESLRTISICAPFLGFRSAVAVSNDDGDSVVAVKRRVSKGAQHRKRHEAQLASLNHATIGYTTISHNRLYDEPPPSVCRRCPGLCEPTTRRASYEQACSALQQAIIVSSSHFHQGKSDRKIHHRMMAHRMLSCGGGVGWSCKTQHEATVPHRLHATHVCAVGGHMAYVTV